MNKKRLVAIGLAAVIGVAGISYGLSRSMRSAHALSADEAKRLVSDVLPSGAQHIGTDEDDKNATFEYYDEGSRTLYEVKVDLQKGEVSNIREYPMERELVPVDASKDQAAKAPQESTKGLLSRQEALDIAFAKVPGAAAEHVKEFELDDRDDRDAKYEIDLVVDGVKYELEIDARTGRLKEFEREEDRSTKSSQSKDDTNVSKDSNNSKRDLLSRDEVLAIVFEKVEGATADHITEFELDDKDERDAEYEVDLVVNGVKYELEIDARSGRILEFERDDDNKKGTSTKAPQTTEAKATKAPTSTKADLITAEEAMNIVLARVDGATKNHFREFELDWDDGRPEYDGELVYNGVEYEFEIDARNGNILDWDVDRDDDRKQNRPTETKATQAPTTQAPTAAPTTQAPTQAPTTVAPTTKATQAPTTAATTSGLITKDRAIAIALEKVPGATRNHIDDIEFDWDDGRPEWEIEIEYNGYEYEIEIDGYSGRILDFEIEKDD